MLKLISHANALNCWQTQTSWHMKAFTVLSNYNHSSLCSFLTPSFFSIHPPYFTHHPQSHQPIFFPSSPRRVRKVSCRFSTGTWRSTAQCTMRHRDLQRSQPLWKTMVYCLSMSCSNCCARPRQETEKYLLPAHILHLQLDFCLSYGLTLSYCSSNPFRNCQ